MAHYVLARNVTTGPLVVTHNGSALGGGEWGAVNADAPEVKRLPEGALITWDELPEGHDLDDEAVAAIASVRERSGDAAEPSKPDAGEGGPAPLSSASPPKKRGS